MSKLTDTKRAYDRLTRLLDNEKRSRRGELNDLEHFQKALDVAFYLLGWAQFEYLVRQESKGIVAQNSTSKKLERYAWKYLEENLKEYPVRKRLDLIFHENPRIRGELDKDYTVRNDAAHDYKHLPPNAVEVSEWLEKLMSIVDDFEH